MDALERYVSELRETADRYAAVRAAVDGALLCRKIAGELEAIQRERMPETLSLCEASAERGLSYSAMQRRVASGVIPNVGEPGRPRVRRCDLFASPTGGPDIAGKLLRARPDAT